ncbi:hypothetical protein ACUNV4_19955 [Granulosicoccus sp. 3-233]|uniref:hypothetical protein n=1 Tax=Granulosicoccus sp. 3-233 TaxID=3417969 RepID=UPI003D343CC8
MQNVHAPIARRHVATLCGNTLPAAVLLCLALALSGCSGSSSAPPMSSGVVTGSGQEEDIGVPDSLLQLEDDPGLLAEIPEVLVTVTTSGVGLQVAYTREGQAEVVPAQLVEAQWLYMQDCLGQSGTSPVVVVRDGPVTPFTATDDVIYDIEGTPVASGSHRTVPILQIQEDDFDVSSSNPGFNLRSIMGRLLWLSASLPERDYPYECARQRPD